ncbi:putative RNA-directed DNA polymerase from transposon X-element, partial [Trichonephila clavipes]
PLPGQPSCKLLGLSEEPTQQAPSPPKVNFWEERTRKRKEMMEPDGNANGVQAKIHELENYVYDNSPDIIALQETFLCPSFDLNLPNYLTHRNDRLNHHGGGTALLVKNSIAHHAIEIFTTAVNITSIEIEGPSDFNAKHRSWNRNHPGNQAGSKLLNCANACGYVISTPADFTRVPVQQNHFPIDIGVSCGLNNFAVESRYDLSRGHNPVHFVVNFNFKNNHLLNCKTITNWNKFQDILSTAIAGNPPINNIEEIEEAINNFNYNIQTATNQLSKFKSMKQDFTLVSYPTRIKIREEQATKALATDPLPPPHTHTPESPKLTRISLRKKARSGYSTAKKAEMDVERECHDDLLRQWGVPTDQELAQFIPVVGKKQKNKIHSPSKDTSSAKKIKTSCENQYEILTVEDPPIDEQGNIIVDDMEIPNRASTLVPHVRAPLPIMIDNVAQPAQLLKRIQELTNQKLVGRMKGKSMRVYPVTPAAYHHIKKLIDEEKLEAFTFQFPEEKEYRVVIREMPVDMPVENIIKEQEEMGIHSKECKVLISRKNIYSLPMPLFSVFLERTPDNKNIYSLKELCSMKIEVDTMRRKFGPAQCYRGQEFFHSSKYCTRNPKCVKCGKPHLTRDYTKTRNEEPT